MEDTNNIVSKILLWGLLIANILLLILSLIFGTQWWVLTNLIVIECVLLFVVLPTIKKLDNGLGVSLMGPELSGGPSYRKQQFRS